MRSLIRSEAGASALTVAVAVLLLMGMAAVAIDIGAGFDERRQDQVAADASALAGAVSSIDGQSKAQIIADIKANAATNLRVPSGTLDWTGCTDPDFLSQPNGGFLSGEAAANGLNPTAPCISFGENSDGVALARIRVRIPDQDTDTTFGRLLGMSALRTSAQAEVELTGEGGYRNFPSMVFSPANPGEEFCIRSSPGSASPTPSENCEGSATGNFGIFLPYFYTNVGGWLCVTGQSSRPSAYSIAVGLDHNLVANPVVSDALTEPQRLNGADCTGAVPVGGPLNPNQITFTQGDDPNITRGLITGSTGGSPPFPMTFKGRLNQKDWEATYGDASVFGFKLDNRPLYTYIDTDVAVSGPCNAAADGPTRVQTAADEADFIQAMSHLASCLSGSPPSNLFVRDIYDTPRLVTVPKLFQDTPCGNASCNYDITTFVPIFITSVYTDDVGTCDGFMVEDSANGFCRHDPGRTGSITDNAPGQRVLKSATAVILSCDMLPPPGSGQKKCQNIGSGGANVTSFLRAELVK